ncbi:WXG100 family type VII secretion target [Actinoplanes subglobosus]|uniref:ESAT-6-like protein n=1 Tax=Actinoplanes subglobosus TaxID=1547892 RepID=A0ABV8IQ92_9ACTN
MSEFQIDHASLHTAAKDTREVRQDIEGDLKKLWGVVDDLAIAWQGKASSGFQTLMSRWSEDTKKLLTAMDNIADLLDKTGTSHQVNDEEQEQMLNKFHQALNP